LGACPVCASSLRSLAYSDARDVVFGVAPGAWQVYSCGDCASFYVDPRPTRRSIGLAYSQYFTHEIDDHDSLVHPRTLVQKLRNDYLRWRFGYDIPGLAPLGRWIVRLMPFRRRRYDRLTREVLPPHPGARLLDVGCGSGAFLAQMREVGWTVVGQDVDEKAAAAARARGIEVRLGPLANDHGDSFDVITANHVIEHVHDPIELLRTCAELLAPKGRLWLATPNADALGRRLYGKYWAGLDSPRHLVLYSRRSLELALRKAGFQRIAIRPAIGPYGSVGTSSSLRRRETGGVSGPLRARAENLLGDTLMVGVPRWGDELIATAER
jgi:2-polyprenyl-3-methyl-5-hydroxy-6-metoxy-1,4-benzoquinol methylase